MAASSSSIESGIQVQALELAPEQPASAGGSGSTVRAGALPGGGHLSVGQVPPTGGSEVEVEEPSDFERRRREKAARRLVQAQRAIELRASLEQTAEEGRNLLNFVYSPDVLLLRQALVCRTLGSLALGTPIPTLFLHVDTATNTVNFANHQRICRRIDRLIGVRASEMRKRYRDLAKTYASLGPQTRGAGNVAQRLERAVHLANDSYNLDGLPMIWHSATASWASSGSVSKTPTGFSWKFSPAVARPPMPLSDVLCLLDAQVSNVVASALPVGPRPLPFPEGPGVDPSQPTPFDEPPSRTELYGVLCRLVDQLQQHWDRTNYATVYAHANAVASDLLCADPCLSEAERPLAQAVSAYTIVHGDEPPVSVPAFPAAHESNVPENMAVAAEEVGARTVDEQVAADAVEEAEVLELLNAEPSRALAPPALRARPPFQHEYDLAVPEVVRPGEAALHPVAPPVQGQAGGCPGPCKRVPRWGWGPGRILDAFMNWYDPPPPINMPVLPRVHAIVPAVPANRVLSTPPVVRPGQPKSLVRGNLYVHEIQSPLPAVGVPHYAVVPGGIHLNIREAITSDELGYLAELFPEFVMDYEPHRPSPQAFRHAVEQGLQMLANRPMPFNVYPDDITPSQTPCWVLTAQFPGTLGITHDKVTYERMPDGYIHFSSEGVPTRRIRAMDWLRAGGKDVRGGHLHAEEVRWCPQVGLGLYLVTLRPGRGPPAPLHTAEAFYGKVQDVRFVTAVGTAMQQSEVGFVPRRWDIFRRAARIWSCGAWYVADNHRETWHIPKGPLAMLRMALTFTPRDKDCRARATNLAKSYLKTLPLTPDQASRMAPGLVAVAMADVGAEIDALRYIEDARPTLNVHSDLLTGNVAPWWKTPKYWLIALAGVVLWWKAYRFLPRAMHFLLPGARSVDKVFARGSMVDALRGSWRALCRFARSPTIQHLRDSVTWPIAELTRGPRSLRAQRRVLHGLPPMSIHPAFVYTAPIYEELIKRCLAFFLPQPLHKVLAGAVFGLAEAALSYIAYRREPYDEQILHQVVRSYCPTVLMHMITAAMPWWAGMITHAAWNFCVQPPFVAGSFFTSLAKWAREVRLEFVWMLENKLDEVTANMTPAAAAVTRTRAWQVFRLDWDRTLGLTAPVYEEPFKRWLATKFKSWGVPFPKVVAGATFGLGESALLALGMRMTAGQWARVCLPTVLAHIFWTVLPLPLGILAHLSWNFFAVSPKMMAELQAAERDALAQMPAVVSTLGCAAVALLFAKRGAPAPGCIVVGREHTVTQYCVLRDFGGYREPPLYAGRLYEGEIKIPVPSSPPCLPKPGAHLYGIGIANHPPVAAGQCEHNVYAAVRHRYFQDTPHPNVRVFRLFRIFYLLNAVTLLGLAEHPDPAVPMSHKAYAKTYPGPRQRQLLQASDRLCDDPFHQVQHVDPAELLRVVRIRVHAVLAVIFILVFVVAGTKIDEQVCGRAREDGHGDFGQLGQAETFFPNVRGIRVRRSFHNAPAALCEGEAGNFIFTKPRLILRSHDFLWQLISGCWIKPLEHRLLEQSKALFEEPDLLDALRARVRMGQRIFVTKGLRPEQRGALTVAIAQLVREESGEPPAEVDADGSNWDSTMKIHMRLLVVEVLRQMRVPEWFLQLLMADTFRTRFRDNWGNFFEGPGAMNSGRTYTAFFHCLVNALITLFCAKWVHDGRPPAAAFVELTIRQVWDWYREGAVCSSRAPPIALPMLVARVDGDDNKSTGPRSLVRKLDCDLYARLHAELGVDMKFQYFEDTFDGDYCSSLSWKCLLGGVQTAVDGPIIGRCLIKCGYGQHYYGKQSTRNAWLKGVFEPSRRDWAHVPILRAVAERCSRVEGRTGKCTLKSDFRKLHVAEAAVADARTWAQFEARYPVSREEALALEGQILAIPQLPALIQSEIIDRIVAVDFPDVR